MKRRIIARHLIIAAIPFIATGVIAQEAICRDRICDGEAPNEMILGNHHFLTTSRVFMQNNDHVYQTCVQNLGDKDLEVKWEIPGLESFVLVGCAIVSNRPHSTRKTIETFNACLRYGAPWDWTRSPFFPHASDQIAIDKEKAHDCRESYIVSDFSDYPVRRRSISIERFAPSIYEDQANTMTQILIDIEVTPIESDNTISTVVSLQFNPAYSNRDHYIKDFTVRASQEALNVLKERNASISGDFVASYSSGETEAIELLTAWPKTPLLTRINYEILSFEERRVASFDVPIWIEGGS